MSMDYSAGYVDSVNMVKFCEKFPELTKKMNGFKSLFFDMEDVAVTDLATVVNEVYYADVIANVVNGVVKIDDESVKSEVLQIFAQHIDYTEEDNEKEWSFLRAYIDLAADFFKQTNGLGLSVFANTELMSGSEPEEFEFQIHGLYELTPQGKKLEDMLVRMFYCC